MSKLISARNLVNNYLADFLTDTQLDSKLQLSFGNAINLDSAIALIQGLISGDNLPPIEVIPTANINNANGAFAGTNGKVYLAQEFLDNHDEEAISHLLVEELGHYLDYELNPTDSPGDEGDIFSRLVRGENIDASTLQALKAENDHATITVDGQVVEIEQALTFGDLVASETIFRTEGDEKDNYLYENVQTINAGVFRARFKNITLPSSTMNIPYTEIPISALNTGSTAPNDTVIDTLDSTEKGLLIHTSINGAGSIYLNLWESTDVANKIPLGMEFIYPVPSSFVKTLGDATDTLNKNLVAEDTFYGTTKNLGNLSRSATSFIKATLVWTGTPSTTDTDADLNLQLEGNTSGLIYTPSLLPLNTPSRLPAGKGFNGTDSVNSAEDRIANTREYIEQIFIPSGDLNPLDSSYKVTVNGKLGSVPSSTGQDFSIFFSVTGVVGNGHGWGDVHLKTFDQKPYDFQAVGDFILVESLIDDFQVQTRQEASPYWTSASVNTAFAINLGGYNVQYDIDLPETERLSLDGFSFELPSGETLDLGIAQITRQNNEYTFTYAGPDGIINTNDDDVVTALVYEDTNDTSRYYINIDVNPADYRSGLLQGLLGNGDGISTNDFALRDGTDLGSPSVQTIHTTYADSWRITEEESLFGTETFADPSFPSFYVSIKTFTDENPEAVAAAFTLARDAGIPEGNFLEGAVLDFLVTGDQSFIYSAKQFADFYAIDSDFNGDGNTDLLWRNEKSDRLSVSYFDGTNKIGEDFIINGSNNNTVSPHPNWNVVKGDLIGTSQKDLLVHNRANGTFRIWEMDQNIIVDKHFLTQTDNEEPMKINTYWEVLTGDFFGDSQDEILLKNKANGKLRIWEINGDKFQHNHIVKRNSQEVRLTDSENWDLATGNFVGISDDDILLRNKENGKMRIWEMEGADIVQIHKVINDGNEFTLNKSWDISTDDLMGTNYDDIVLRHINNGTLRLWEMEENSILNTITLQDSTSIDSSLVI